MESGKAKSNARLEKLQQSIEFYNATIDVSREELIKNEYAPFVEKIQNDDKTLLEQVIFKFLNFLKNKNYLRLIIN